MSAIAVGENGVRRGPAFRQRARQDAAQRLVVAIEQETSHEPCEQRLVLRRLAHLDAAHDDRDRIAGLARGSHATSRG